MLRRNSHGSLTKCSKLFVKEKMGGFEEQSVNFWCIFVTITLNAKKGRLVEVVKHSEKQKVL